MSPLFNVEDIIFSILIGSIPTASMLLASFALMNLKVEPLIEACFQNFCAGLILAAVAMELFPLMAPSEIISPFNSIVGTSLGFILGIAMINGVDQLISSFENDTREHAHDGEVAMPKCEVSSKNYKSEKSGENATGNQSAYTTQKWESSPAGGRRSTPLMPWMFSSSNAADGSLEMKACCSETESTRILNTNGSQKQSYNQPYSLVLTPKEDIDVEKFDQDRDGCAEDGYDHEAILYAAIAIATPSHRAHIKEHFIEIMNAIFLLEHNAISLMRGNTPLDLRQSEILAEEIDEGIHMLQYRLDHTRR